MRRLFLLRHGEAAPAAQDGPSADPWVAPLTPRGRAQVADLAEALAALSLDLIVTSTVPRALETAAILAHRTALTPIADDGLDELRPGRVVAGPPEAVRMAVRQAYRDAGQPGARFLDGEAFAAFGLRVDQALARILSRPGWSRAAVVTHEPALRYVLARCHGLGLAGLDAFEAANASVTVLDCSPGVIAWDAAALRLANGTGDEATRLK
ncbi:histidine phosphatase family protein [Elioraea sp.]|uniref:histidine phosphatase family protein n=1 Tax=Elioraea sp. TaxID=2185103 RepID=UPI0025B856E4|nr:histidine phosphatase family protein [Elioraea sp.]